MTVEEALNYINSHSWSQWRLGLSRTIELLDRVGNPQKDLKFVHIAGTNGKGSTSAMIASMLIASGYRTGMYPSPYIERFNERLQINGVQIEDDDLCRLTEIVKAAGDAMEDHPTHFEIITAIGMLYFKEMGCDIVVLEVGLGGSFDSTNVIDTPELCVITNIGIDHTNYLGDTLAEIASAKAGIIKSGADVVCYPNVPEVMEVIERTCRDKGAELYTADFDRIDMRRSGLQGQEFLWIEKTNRNADRGAAGSVVMSEADSAIPSGANDLSISLPLSGDYQLRNAAVALTAAEKLAAKGWNITKESVIEGMSKVKWPARFELLGTDPVFILDGGHNLQCAEAVAESLGRYFPEGGLTLLIGMLEDKNYGEAVEAILPYISKCVCVTPDSERALPAAELADVIKEHAAEDLQEGRRGSYIDVTVYDSVSGALKECLNGKAPVLAFGSLYLAGEVRRAYREAKEQEEDLKSFKKKLRREKIRAREALSEEDRIGFSADICRRIIETPEYEAAKTILVYKWVKGEVKLDALEEEAESDGKTLLYPLCISKGEMIAVAPGRSSDAWKDSGFMGIREPDPEKGTAADPADIDLIIAPCSSFDDRCRRLGMGGGFYDRYLPKCVNAKVIAAAFEAQRSEEIPTDEYDRAVDAVATETALIRAHK